ncbi:MAG: DUF4276 family protein [Planctomycetes bacterium]|nr:DUF4276 family protein [Planctomycetota bacterium]
MRLVPIVEGHGEVAAIPVLLRRFQSESGTFGFQVARPIRRHRSDLVREASLRQSVHLAMLQQDCGAILIFLDSDDDCPKELAPALERWAREEAGNTPCAVVMAHREYEAWLLAAIESLRGHRGIQVDASAPPDAEAPRDAKGRLEDFMAGRSYWETTDQAALTQQFDLARAYAACRSFRHLAKAFGSLLSQAGIRLDQWPPVAWLSHPTP